MSIDVQEQLREVVGLISQLVFGPRLLISNPYASDLFMACFQPLLSPLHHFVSDHNQSSKAHFS